MQGHQNLENVNQNLIVNGENQQINVNAQGEFENQQVVNNVNLNQVQAEVGVQNNQNLAPLNQNENQLGMFKDDPVPVPPKAIHRGLHKVIKKICSWESLKLNTSLPVRTAAEMLLNATTDKGVNTAIERILEASTNYMQVNSGHRSAFGGGEARKEDVRTLLKEVCVYAAENSHHVLLAMGLAIDGLNQDLKYKGVIKTEFDKAIANRYGEGTNLKQARMAAMIALEEKADTIREWGSIADKAKELLDGRGHNETIELNFEKVVFEQAVGQLSIPDVKSLDDYELLTFPDIERCRHDVYEPLAQNLEYLIARGEITDKAQIAEYHSKMALLGKELDLYDARVRRMAGREAEGDKKLLDQSAFLEDMEKDLKADEEFKQDHTLQLKDYKKLAKVLNPRVVLNKQTLLERENIIEKNRARSAFLNGAVKTKTEKKLLPVTEFMGAEEALAHCKEQADRIFGADLTVLFNMDVSEDGMLKGATGRLEIIDMLLGIDDLVATCTAKEKLLGAETRKEMRTSGRILVESEIAALKMLSDMGKRVKLFYDKNLELYNNTDGNELFTLSDYEALSAEARAALVRKPENGQAQGRDAVKMRNLCRKYQEILDIRGSLAQDISSWPEFYGVMKNNVSDQKNSIREAYQQELQQKLLMEQQEQQRLREEHERQLKAEQEARERAEREKEENRRKLVKEVLNTVGAKENQMKAGLDERDSYAAVGDRSKALDAFTEKSEKARNHRLITKNANAAIDEYMLLPKKTKKDSDARQAREKAVEAIAGLTGITKSEFDLVETSEIIGLLSDIQNPETYDAAAFKEQTQEVIKKTVEDYVNTRELTDIQYFRNHMKTQKEKLDLRDKCVKALGAVLDRCVKSRESLDKYSTETLAEYSVQLLTIIDINVDPEDVEEGEKYKEPTLAQKETFKEVTCKTLAMITGKNESDFAFISLPRLGEIFITALSCLGNDKKDEKTYALDQLALEERMKLISDAYTAYENFDKKSDDLAPLLGIRDKMAEAISLVTGKAEAEFEFLRLDEMSQLLQSVHADLKKHVKDNKEKIYDVEGLLKPGEEAAKALEEMLASHTDELFEQNINTMATSGEMSEEYREYLDKELTMDVYIRMASKLGVFGKKEKKFTRKDFENADAKDLGLVTLLGLKRAELEGAKPGIDEKELRDNSEVLVGMLMGTDNSFVEKIPACDISAMAEKVIRNVVDKDALKNTIDEIKDYHKIRYQSGDFLKDCYAFMEAYNKDKTKKYCLENIRELCSFYLTEVSKESGFDSEKIKEQKTIVLLELTAKQYEQDKENGFKEPESSEEKKSAALKLLHSLESAGANISDAPPLNSLIIDSLDENKKEKPKFKEWNVHTRMTLEMLGDLVSEEQIFSNGKPATGANRTRSILQKNIAAVTKIINGILVGDNSSPLLELRDHAKGAEGGIVLGLAGKYFEKLKDFLPSKYANSDGLTEKEVFDFINNHLNVQQINELDELLANSCKDGENAINDLIGMAAANLFGAKEDDLIPGFLPGFLDEKANKIEAQEEPKSKKEISNEQLRQLREAVYDTNKGQGKFLYLAIKDYYKDAPPEVKKSMLSYLIKEMKPTVLTTSISDKGAQYFTSILKGAGPIMQKLFQGIPENMLTQPFLPALSVVKSNLSPIPPAYVDRKLKSIVKETNDKLEGNKKAKYRVKEIQKLQSLGAASIAETFLCNVIYEGKAPEQVVIKILRPNVTYKTLQKEKDYIMGCAKKTDTEGVMQANFKAHYNKIWEELDFNNEKNNALLGKMAYTVKDKKTGAAVKSVAVNANIPSGTDYLVMDKAEGITADRYIEELRNFVTQKLSEFASYDPATGKQYSIKPGEEDKRFKIRQEIIDKIAEAQQYRKNMELLVNTWIEKALFVTTGKGCFHHGDLHAGNIMINKNQATVLDYGNCTTLNEGKLAIGNRTETVNEILKMTASAFIGDTNRFVHALERALSLDKTNPYNTMDVQKKAVLRQQLVVELGKIMKMGEPSKTGARIFAAFLKAQELGIMLPPEIQNFSQCQQRLENSLDEFNGAIEGLDNALLAVDTMPVTYKNSFSSLDPVKRLYNILARKKTLEDVRVWSEYMHVGMFDNVDEQRLKGELGKKSPDNIFWNLHSMDAFKAYKANFDKNKDAYMKIINDAERWKKLYPDYERIMLMKPEDIKDEKDKMLKEQLTAMNAEMFQAAFLLTQPDKKTNECANEVVLGKRLTDLISKASQGEKHSFDKFIEMLTVDMPMAYKMAESYENYWKADSKKKKVIGPELIKTFMDVDLKQALKKDGIKELHRMISPDLDPINYYGALQMNAVTANIESDIRKPNNERSLFMETEESTEQDKKYFFGDTPKKVLALYNEFNSIDKDSKYKSEEERAKRKVELKKALAREYSFLELTYKNWSYQDTVEENLHQYFHEDSELGRKLLQKYNNLCLTKKKYMDAYHNPDSADIESLKVARLRADEEFFRTYFELMHTHLKTIGMEFNKYVPKHNKAFVEIMNEVIFKNKITVGALFGKDSLYFQNECAKIAF